MSDDRNQRLATALAALNLAGFNRAALRGRPVDLKAEADELARQAADLSRQADERRAAATVAEEQARAADDEYEGALDGLEEFGIDREAADRLVDHTMRTLTVAGVEMGLPSEQRAVRKRVRGSRRADADQGKGANGSAVEPSGQGESAAKPEGLSTEVEGSTKSQEAIGHPPGGDGQGTDKGDDEPTADEREVVRLDAAGDADHAGAPDLASPGAQDETLANGHLGGLFETPGTAREEVPPEVAVPTEAGPVQAGEVESRLADGRDAPSAVAAAAPVGPGSRPPPPAPSAQPVPVPSAQPSPAPKNVVIPDFMS